MSHFIVSRQSIKIANDGYLVMLDNLGKDIGVDKVNIKGTIISTKWCYVPKEGNLVKEQTTPLGDWLKG